MFAWRLIRNWLPTKGQFIRARRRGVKKKRRAALNQTVIELNWFINVQTEPYEKVWLLTELF